MPRDIYKITKITIDYRRWGKRFVKRWNELRFRNAKELAYVQCFLQKLLKSSQGKKASPNDISISTERQFVSLSSQQMRGQLNDSEVK